MQKLCRITVPGLSVKRDFTVARRRLMAEFPDIQEVIATTAPGPLLALGRPVLRNPPLSVHRPRAGVEASRHARAA